MSERMKPEELSLSKHPSIYLSIITLSDIDFERGTVSALFLSWQCDALASHESALFWPLQSLS